MAVPAKDGSYHHSAGRASLHNEMHSEKGKSPVKDMSKPKDGEGEGKSSMSIEEHVKANGPAHMISYTHDKDTNKKHHVHSTHGDGKMHKSEHGSHEEAHAHMAKAMGVGQNESPDEANDEANDIQMAHTQPNSGGGGNPFLND